MKFEDVYSRRTENKLTQEQAETKAPAMVFIGDRG